MAERGVSRREAAGPAKPTLDREVADVRSLATTDRCTTCGPTRTGIAEDLAGRCPLTTSGNRGPPRPLPPVRSLSPAIGTCPSSDDTHSLGENAQRFGHHVRCGSQPPARSRCPASRRHIDWVSGGCCWRCATPPGLMTVTIRLDDRASVRRRRSTRSGSINRCPSSRAWPAPRSTCGRALPQGRSSRRGSRWSGVGRAIGPRRCAGGRLGRRAVFGLEALV
jgi:hypothetical protein